MYEIQTTTYPNPNILFQFECFMAVLEEETKDLTDEIKNEALLYTKHIIAYMISDARKYISSTNPAKLKEISDSKYLLKRYIEKEPNMKNEINFWLKRLYKILAKN